MLCKDCLTPTLDCCGRCHKPACWRHGTKLGEHFICRQCLRLMPQAIVRRMAEPPKRLGLMPALAMLMASSKVQPLLTVAKIFL